MAQELRPLVVVLGEMDYLRPELVLMRGTNYWLVKRLVMRARHDINAGPDWARQAILIPEFWWEQDPQGKAVIWRVTSEGPRILVAEAGSEFVPQEGEA